MLTSLPLPSPNAPAWRFKLVGVVAMVAALGLSYVFTDLSALWILQARAHAHKHTHHTPTRPRACSPPCPHTPSRVAVSNVPSHQALQSPHTKPTPIVQNSLLMVGVAPSFVLGLYVPSMHPGCVCLGISAGLAVALSLGFAYMDDGDADSSSSPGAELKLASNAIGLACGMVLTATCHALERRAPQVLLPLSP